MKIGEKVPVQIGHHVVAQATVKELGDGTATLIVPATLVVMGTRTTLDDLPPAGESDTETLIMGVDRASESPVESTTGSEPNQNNEAVTEQPVASGDASAPATGETNSAEPVAPVNTETVEQVVEPAAVESTPEA